MREMRADVDTDLLLLLLVSQLFLPARPLAAIKARQHTPTAGR